MLILLLLLIVCSNGMSHSAMPKTLFIKSTGKYADMRMPTQWLIEESEMFKNILLHRAANQAWLLRSKEFKGLKIITPFLVLMRCKKEPMVYQQLTQKKCSDLHRIYCIVDYFNFTQLLIICEKALAYYYEQHLIDFLQDADFTTTIEQRGLTKYQADRIATHIDIRSAPLLISPIVTSTPPQNFCYSSYSGEFHFAQQFNIYAYKNSHRQDKIIPSPRNFCRYQVNENKLVVLNNKENYIRYFRLADENNHYSTQYTFYLSRRPKELCCDFENNILAIAFEDNSLEIYDLTSNTLLYSLENTQDISHLVLGKQATLLCVSNYKHLVVWELINRKKFFETPSKSGCSSFSHKGNHIACDSSVRATLYIHNIYTKKQLEIRAHADINTIQWSPDDFYLLCSFGMFQIAIFESTTGCYLRMLPSPSEYMGFIDSSNTFRYPQHESISLIPKNLSLEQALLVLAFIKSIHPKFSNKIFPILSHQLENQNKSLLTSYINLPNNIKRDIQTKYLFSDLLKNAFRLWSYI